MATTQPSLDSFKGLLGSGNLGGAYTGAKAAGYKDTEIADWASKNYDTSKGGAAAWMKGYSTAPTAPMAKNTAAATQQDVNQFDQYLGQGDYGKALELGRSFGYGNEDITKYIGQKYGAEAGDAAKGWMLGYDQARQDKIIPTVDNRTYANQQQLDQFNKYIKGGEYDTAYAYGKSFGYTDQEIANYLQGQYGTSADAILGWMAAKNAGSGRATPGEAIISNYQAPTNLNYSTAAAPGLIDAERSKIGDVGAIETERAKAQGYTPTNWEVDPTKLSDAEAARILSKDSALMQGAQGIGRQQAQARGMLNSSIGNSAVVGSMLQPAERMGTQNAQTYAAAGQTNAAAANQAAQFGAQAQNVAELANVAQANQAKLTQAEMQAQVNINNAKMAFDAQAQNVANAQQNLQFNASEENKAKLQQALMAQDKAKMDLDQAQFNAQEAGATSRFNIEQQNAQTLARQQMAQAQAESQRTREYNQAESQKAREFESGMQSERLKSAADLAQKSIDANFKDSAMKAQLSRDLANAQMSFDALTKSSSTAAAFTEALNSKIEQIASLDMEPAAKQQLISTIIRNYNVGMNNVNALMNINWGDLFVEETV
jgi:hypothetical protein